MKYEKIYPRKWNFKCAQSGMHLDWSLNNARDFALLAQSIGMEPWEVFPGTRQVGIETYDQVTNYQVSLFAEAIQKSKLGRKVAKVWIAGQRTIYIDYVGSADKKLAAKLPEFEVGDVLRHLVSDKIVTVIEVGNDYYTIRESSGYNHRVHKCIVKCSYKLKKR